LARLLLARLPLIERAHGRAPLLHDDRHFFA
jgi:hypothetical protein